MKVSIEWHTISEEEIHGIINGVVEFSLLRDINPPYEWRMSGLVESHSQYSLDLMSQAGIFYFNQSIAALVSVAPYKKYIYSKN